MYVRIRRLRLGGRRIPHHEAYSPDHTMIADLQANGGRFELHPPHSTHGPLHVLYDAHVHAVLGGGGGMLIRGYEEHRGAAVLQEWEVTPVGYFVDEKGIKRWDGLE